MSYNRNAVLKIARDELGYLEKSRKAYQADPAIIYKKKEGAGSDNITKYNVELHKLYPAVMDISYWCDSFVDWCFMQAYGVSNARKLLAGDFDDYTVNSAELYKKAGAWYTTPRVGDQIFFKNSSRICHTGLVVDVVSASKTVVTIEGNTSGGSEIVSNGGAVCEKTYSISNSRIAGYGRPDYGRQENFAYTPHWVRSGDDWYYRVSDGVNAHNWLAIDGHWYWFDKKGKMATGPQKIDGSWYYFATAEMTTELEGACCKTVQSGALKVWDLI